MSEYNEAILDGSYMVVTCWKSERANVAKGPHLSLTAPVLASRDQKRIYRKPDCARY